MIGKKRCGQWLSDDFEVAVPTILGHLSCTMTTSIELPFAKNDPNELAS
jgi:hypothetical protein